MYKKVFPAVVGLVIIGLVVGGTNTNLALAVDQGTTTRMVSAYNLPSAYPNNTTSEGTVSADGKFVYMTTKATNMLPDDTNNSNDAVMRVLGTGQYERISVSTTGEQANASSNASCVSEDGRYALFTSSATSLTAQSNIYPGKTQLYLRDRELNTTQIVSTNASGTPADNGVSLSSGEVSSFISNDERFIFFNSNATNLVSGTTGYHAYMKDTKLNTITVLDKSSSGTISNGSSFIKDVNDDGTYVTFYSYGSNITTGDNNNRRDIFVVDLRNGQAVENISKNFDNDINVYTNSIKLSNNGKYIAFVANSSNIVSGMSGNADYHAYLYDRVHNKYQLIDQSSNSDIADRSSNDPADAPGIGGVSDEGRVAFDSRGYNLVEEDTSNTNTGRQVFMRDVVAGATTLISVGDNTLVSPRDARALDISRNGKKIVFTTTGLSSFVAGSDGSGHLAVFMRELNQ